MCSFALAWHTRLSLSSADNCNPLNECCDESGLVVHVSCPMRAIQSWCASWHLSGGWNSSGAVLTGRRPNEVVTDKAWQGPTWLGSSV